MTALARTFCLDWPPEVPAIASPISRYFRSSAQRTFSGETSAPGSPTCLHRHAIFSAREALGLVGNPSEPVYNLDVFQGEHHIDPCDIRTTPPADPITRHKQDVSTLNLFRKRFSAIALAGDSIGEYAVTGKAANCCLRKFLAARPRRSCSTPISYGLLMFLQSIAASALTFCSRSSAPSDRGLRARSRTDRHSACAYATASV